ncbi:MAG: hypothetical protein IPM56_03810 [Ignavibacteriales bacterium]|nr:MAG: hypothetical protein IPM56_03810 [Ignavibacteriales bacterium]
MNSTKWFYFILPILFSILILTGCETDDPIDEENPSVDKANISSCEGCHTNYEVLKSIASPDTIVAGGGCGGETPHIEPYDRVFMGGSGYADFKSDIHGKLNCTVCHNGVDNTPDKKLAHSGDFIKHPSDHSVEKCGSCHPNIVNGAKNSIHEQGWGQKNMVVSRSGLNSFDELSDLMKKGYDENCGKCHASCGDCHINRPAAGGGGLYKSHSFTKTPNMVDHCTTCHTSRGGHAFFGVASGTVPDVHRTQAGFTCMSCHSKHEIHGDGNIYNQRYKYPELPTCDNPACHSGLAQSNQFHTAHLSTFSCYTCHSQEYNNCGSCHIGGEGARIHAYQGYKIGMNPIPAVRNYEFALLRRSLMAPDSWINYGTPVLSNFDAHPTYKYTTPHNILRFTERTQVEAGKPCYDACHIIKEGTELRNKELYLFESDLLPWEVNATKHITVDGKLPSGWGLN